MPFSETSNHSPELKQCSIVTKQKKRPRKKQKQQHLLSSSPPPPHPPAFALHCMYVLISHSLARQTYYLLVLRLARLRYMAR
jgi:hypothetical protein